MDLVILVRAFYLTCAAIILAACAFPALHAPFLTYGSRNTKPEASQNGSCSKPVPSDSKDDSSANSTPNTPPAKATTSSSSLLDTLGALQVPHSWFTHFYILSTTLTLFWFHQLTTRGPIFHFIASLTNTATTSSTSVLPPTSMTLGQVYLLLILFLTQGIRRMIESFLYLPSSKRSKSTMHLSHYLLGHLFYLFDNLAIWLEGVPALLVTGQCPFPHVELTQPKFLIAISLFLVASVVQNRAHAYLARLRATTTAGAYQLPEGRLFRYVVCPHYTAEVVIYICLAIVAAPREGTWMGMNGTMLDALIFVGVNLGVTAKGTREWYVRLFGEDKLRRRWRILPGVW